MQRRVYVHAHRPTCLRGAGARWGFSPWVHRRRGVARRVFGDRAATTTTTTGAERVRATYRGLTTQTRGCERTRARRGHRTRVGGCDAREARRSRGIDVGAGRGFAAFVWRARRALRDARARTTQHTYEVRLITVNGCIVYMRPSFELRRREDALLA
jgi:hypothetical protein